MTGDRNNSKGKSVGAIHELPLPENLPQLPVGWVWTRVGEIAEINPKFLGNNLTNISEVSFLPMKAVEERTGKIDLSDTRKLSQVKKGYTPFKDGDILFAKITPCMENGKIAVAKNLKNGVGFGSTEFHVIRIGELIDKKFLFFFLLQDDYRKVAQGNMTGSAGQLRVPAYFVENTVFPLPPFTEQRRIVARIEEFFTRLEAGVEELRKAKAQLRRYRQSVLKHAFEGRLTEEWRKAHKDELEPAPVLLERIKEERKKNTKAKFKGLPPIDTSDLPELPEGWVWTMVGEISPMIQYGYTEKATNKNVGPKFLRITDIQNGSISWDDVPYCKIDDTEKERYLLQPGDLVFARTGATVGKSYLICEKTPEAVFASYLIRLKLTSEVNKKFVYNFFQCQIYWQQINRGKIGIGQPNVNGNKLARTHIPLPSHTEQHKIVEEIERCLSVADEVEKAIDQGLRQAERLRQSILKRAFEGKLVPQDPSDEPASVLLERIRLQRQQGEQEVKPRRRKASG